MTGDTLTQAQGAFEASNPPHRRWDKYAYIQDRVLVNQVGHKECSTCRALLGYGSWVVNQKNTKGKTHHVGCYKKIYRTMLVTQGIDLIKSFPPIAYLKFSEWRDAELQQEDDGWHDTLTGVVMAIHRDIGIGKQSEKQLQQKIPERMASGTLGDTKELQYKINERGVG